MKLILPLRFKKNRATGIVEVAVPTPRGRKWCPTGQVTADRARLVCNEAMVGELQMAACANALTHDVISRLTTGRRFTCGDIYAAWHAETSIDLAPDTQNGYALLLRQWMADARCAGEPLTFVKRRVLHDFINERSVAIGTRKSRLAALRSFFHFASAAGYCVGNMAERVRVDTRDLYFTEIETVPTNPLPPGAYEALMASPRVTGFYRWATALGYWLGLRLRDIACLEWASIQPEHIVLYMRKTRKRLSLPLADPLIGSGELVKILAEIAASTTDRGVFCFPQMRAIALDPKKRAQMSVYYGRILARHGITGCSFHSTRHALAVRLKVAGKTLEQIAATLGHASTTTTEIYANH